MTNADHTSPATALTPKTSARIAASSLASGLALILSTIALLASAYLGYTFIEKRGIYRAVMFDRLDKLEDASAQQQQAVDVHAQKLATLEETETTLKTGMEKMFNEFYRGRSDWLLAETEQLMLIANHRLHLAHDVHLALEALRAADRQLQQLANPRYLPVRKAVAEEMAQLEALDRIDIPGMSVRLGSMGAHVDRLPITPETRRAAEERASRPADTAEKKSVGQEMWSDINSLIRIRRSDELRKPLLPPEQQYFLRENLRLMLYGAQTALLQGNAATFEQNIQSARQWLGDYYDVNAPAVRSAQADLDRMLKARVSLNLPDISASLELLRKLSGKKAGP